MAVLGVGIDLVRIERISRLVGRWGDRFLARVFTESEREACSRRTNHGPCFAMRFAAKEAFVKALGLGMRSPVQWLDIQVRNDPLGKPIISLSPRAEAYCAGRGVTAWHLSLTDEGEYAAAVVVLER
ncbi:MAG: holo-ACP synthase [Deltaproteobacteria bacterium]|nr:holo-ACP synthase [Deltaproteobacteria bacterium]